MTKNFEYKEPEFKVVMANCEDILTASGGQGGGEGGQGGTPAADLTRIAGSWEMGTFTI